MYIVDTHFYKNEFLSGKHSYFVVRKVEIMFMVTDFQKSYPAWHTDSINLTIADMRIAEVSETWRRILKLAVCDVSYIYNNISKKKKKKKKNTVLIISIYK